MSRAAEDRIRRMLRARDTGRPVTEISFDVGFASLGTFSRTFSAVVGSSSKARVSIRVSAGRSAAPARPTPASAPPPAAG